jgi:hypothetical protein
MHDQLDVILRNRPDIVEATRLESIARGVSPWIKSSSRFLAATRRQFFPGEINATICQKDTKRGAMLCRHVGSCTSQRGEVVVDGKRPSLIRSMQSQRNGLTMVSIPDR